MYSNSVGRYFSSSVSYDKSPVSPPVRQAFISSVLLVTATSSSHLQHRDGSQTCPVAQVSLPPSFSLLHPSQFCSLPCLQSGNWVSV